MSVPCLKVRNTREEPTPDQDTITMSVEATRRRATVGEISYAMEREFGRFNAQAQTVSGVYGSAFQDDEDWQGISKDIDAFVERHGRRPRMLVCKMGQDVHVVGASSLAAGHKTLVPELIEELRKQGADDIIVIAGGVIPQQDYPFLQDAGVKCIFGPGTPIPQAAREVLDAVNQLRG